MKLIFLFSSFFIFSNAHARSFGSCARQMNPIRDDAQVCLHKADVIDRYVCMAPVRNTIHGPDFQGCQSFVKAFETSWEHAEKKEFYHRPVIGLVSAPDPVACRKPMPVWASKLRQCALIKNDKQRGVCKKQVAKLIAPQKKVCGTSFNRLNTVVSAYESHLYPSARLPAVAESGPEITLRRAKKAR